MRRKDNAVKLSIIVVYFGNYQELSRLIRSIYQNKIKNKFEIIVIDNKGEDIEAKLKKLNNTITYINSGSNLGYAKGNNLGAKFAKGKVLLITNPDTKIIKGKIDELIVFLETHDDAAIIAPNLAHPNGKFFKKQGTRLLTPVRAVFSLSVLSQLFPQNPYLRDYYMYDLPKSTFRSVDVVPGSAFMVRSNVFKKLKGFDENFFLFFEEMDFCKRIKEMGFEIYMTPFVVFQHDWKPNEGGKEIKRIFARSRFYYFKKHFGLINAIIIEFFVRLSKKSLFWMSVIIIGFISLKLV